MKHKKVLNQLGVVSLHTLLPVVLVVAAVGAVGAYVISKSSAAPQKPLIQSATFTYKQTQDLNNNGKMNLGVRVEGAPDVNKVDLLQYQFSNITLDKKIPNGYEYWTFFDCKTKGKGMSQYGYTTRTFALTTQPTTLTTLEGTWGKKILTKVLEDSWSDTYYRDMQRDFVENGAVCKADLGLKRKNDPLNRMDSFSWYPNNGNPNITHPHEGHPFTFEVLPENQF